MGGQEDGIYFLIQSRAPRRARSARGVIHEIAEGLYFYVDGISFRSPRSAPPHPSVPVPFIPRTARAVIRYAKIDMEWNLSLSRRALFLSAIRHAEIYAGIFLSLFPKKEKERTYLG